MSIPIAIHLFFRRRTLPVEWAAMAMLQEAIRRTARHRRLQRLMLLALRCVAVVLAGLAIGGPLLAREQSGPSGTAMSESELIIVLDDGIAQHARVGSESAIERGRTLALKAIDAMGPSDRVGVIRSAGAQPLVWPPSTDLASARAAINTVEATFQESALSEAIEATLTRDRTTCVISDFRQGSITDSSVTITTEPGSRLLLSPPATIVGHNTQIIQLEAVARPPSAPRNLWPLRVKLRREGSSLSPSINAVEAMCGESRTMGRVEWAEGQAGATIEVFMQTSTEVKGDSPVRVSIVEPDAQPADNTRFTIAVGSPALRVGVVTRDSSTSLVESDGANQWIDRSLRPIEGGDIDLEPIDPATLDTGKLARCDAIIILRPDLLGAKEWLSVARRVEDGLVAIVAPPTEATSSLWSDEMVIAFSLGWTIAREPRQSEVPEPVTVSTAATTPLSRIAPELTELTRPASANRWFEMTIPEGKGTTFLELMNGSPLLASANLEHARGTLMVFSSAIDLAWNNLPAKPLMVPLMQELLRQSVASVARGSAAVVGVTHLSRAIPRARELRLVTSDSTTTTSAVRPIAIDPQGKLAQPLTRPGVYQAQDGVGVGVGWVIVNIDADAARVAPTPPDAVTGMFRGIGCTIAQGDLAKEARRKVTGVGETPTLPVAVALSGESIAPWFFWALVVFAITESTLARSASIGSGPTHHTGTV